MLEELSLIVIDPKGRRTFDLDVRAVTILGRDSACTIRIRSPEVSRRHISLSPGSSGLLLEDLGSRNGTYLNGKKIRQAFVQKGDRIELHDVVILLEAGSAPLALPNGSGRRQTGGGATREFQIQALQTDQLAAVDLLDLESIDIEPLQELPGTEAMQAAKIVELADFEADMGLEPEPKLQNLTDAVSGECAKCAEHDDAIEALHVNHNEALEELAEHRRWRADISDRNRMLRQQLDHAQERARDLAADRGLSVADEERYSRTVEDLHADLQAARARNRRLEEELSRLRTTVETYESDHAALQEELAEARVQTPVPETDRLALRHRVEPPITEKIHLD